MIKPKVAFLEGRLFPINQSFLKTSQIPLIDWIKAALPKSHFCFDHVNRLSVDFVLLTKSPIVSEIDNSASARYVSVRTWFDSCSSRMKQNT